MVKKVVKGSKESFHPENFHKISHMKGVYASKNIVGAFSNDEREVKAQDNYKAAYGSSMENLIDNAVEAGWTQEEINTAIAEDDGPGREYVLAHEGCI